MKTNTLPLAIVLTGGFLGDRPAKTGNGLVRDSERYRIAGVVDPAFGGLDAGQVVCDRPNGIPVFASVEDVFKAGLAPELCIIGCAPFGAKLDDNVRQEILVAIQHGLSLVSGLHFKLANDPEIRAAATVAGVNILDIRQPRSELQFHSGRILQQASPPRIAVLGTDMAVGKRTTTRLLNKACRLRGLRSEVIFTGQTGWLQGGQWGLFMDATPNDFVTGELEHSIFECIKEANPHVLFLEGQSALRHPLGPCGAELIVSTAASGVILQHAPGRKYYDGLEGIAEIPPFEEDIACLRDFYRTPVLGIAFSEEGLSRDEALRLKNHYTDRLGLPVVLPLVDIEPLVDVIVRQLRPNCENVAGACGVAGR